MNERLQSAGLEKLFPGSGEMARRMREFPWERSPLGDPSTWPKSLATAVHICLTSRFPIVLWWGKDLRLLYNDAWRPVLGKTKHPAALGSPGREVWPEIWHIIGPMLQSVLEKGEATWSDDQLLPHERNGCLEEAYFTYSYSPIPDEHGGTGGVFAMVNETTPKRAEEELRESEQRLRLALEAGRMGSWEWHIPTNRVTWSPGLEAIHGLAPGTFAGTFEAYRQDIHPDDRDYVQRCVGQTLEGRDHHIQYRIVLPEGSVRWVEGRGRLFRDERGAAVRVVGVCSDITERKRAEENLRRSEQELSDFFESAAIGLHWVGPDGIIQRANRAELEMLGYTKDEYVGRHIAQFHADRPVIDEILARLTCGERLNDYPARLRCKDGSVRDVLINSSVLFENGEFIHTRCFTLDVTARKRAEQALRESDRRKDEFIAMLSHELRNPLAPLRSALELLRMAPAPALEPARIHEMMERQTRHLVRLVDDLLEMSRINRGTLELRRERVSVETVVRNAVETSEPLIREAEHALEIALPAEPLWLDGDPVRLAQILSNLLNNAARYTPHGGRIAVRAEGRGGVARISVRDNGQGFAAGAAPLFEMFTRGERSSGLGIGLALARRLAELHGGSLEARSEGEGKGAEFTIVLPVAARGPSGRSPDAPTTGDVTQPVPRRILVADDNRDAAESLAMVLRALGGEVSLAYDGAEAVEQARIFRPDLAILDIGMPKVNGYDAAKRIRRELGAQPVKIVALTGWGQDEDKRRSREAGFDAHLVKPAEMEALRAMLASLTQDTAQN